jgi:hypothetical protein
MKNLFPPKKAFLLALAPFVLSFFFIPASGEAGSEGQEKVQHEIERAKIYRDTYPLISETDLYCSIFVQERDLPDVRIIAAERSGEKLLLGDDDVVFINKGQKDGLEVGQVFLIIELEGKLSGFGNLAAKRGRANVTFLEDNRSVARVEKSCGRVMVGDYLLPFEEKETLLGKDLGFDASLEGESGLVGNIIYLNNDLSEIGSGSWAIIDLGENDGIQTGQQMTIFRQVREGMPKEGIGNVVVIDTQAKTATVKVLSCSDAIHKGMQVQGK